MKIAHFKKINHEKYVNFADFQQNKRIFTLPIAKKGLSFTDFWRIKRIFTQPIVIKGSSFQIFGDMIADVHNQ